MSHESRVPSPRLDARPLGALDSESLTRDSRLGTRDWAWLIALFLFAVYLLFYQGDFKNSADEWFMYALGDSLARNAALDVDQMAYVGEFKGLAKFGPDGHLYSKYSPVQALLAVPLLWLGRWLPEVGQAQLALLVNPVLTAATAALLFSTVGHLGYSTRSALATTLTFGLATGAFVYAKTFTSEVSTAFGLTLALYATTRFLKAGQSRMALLAGAALGLIVVSKQANAAAVPGFVLVYWLARRWDGRTWLSFGAPLALAATVVLAYNAVRFGDPLQTGYGPADGGFTASWLESLPGLLVSPGRGILLYSPVLWLALVSGPAFGRRHPRTALLLVAAGLPLALLVAKWHGWHGGLAAWGPRYWMPLLPLACLPLAELYQRLGRPRPTLGWVVVGLILVVSVSIQLSAVSVNYLAYVEEFGTARQIDLLNEDEQLGRLAFEPASSPLLHQWRFLRPRFSDVAWLARDSSGQVRFDPVALALPVLALAAVLWAFSQRGRGRLGPATYPVVTGLVALAAIALAGRVAQAAARPDAEWSAAVRLAQREARPNAALVTVGIAPLAATFTWLKSDLDHFGLAAPPAGDLDPLTERWLGLAGEGHTEIWTIWPDQDPRAFEGLLNTLGPPSNVYPVGALAVRRFMPPDGGHRSMAHGRPD